MADRGGREDDDEVLMRDILSAQEELEETVTAVLGDSDDKNCTYGQGYVKRQAVYSCSTCLSPSGEPAAICLACSLECHDGHNLIELYTKRNLRCDCGNRKFPASFTCRLLPDKDAVNDRNVYNQNFSGRYCVCRKPYPDPDDDVEDEMLQCAVCEDWFHTRHLGITAVPREDAYEEMICGTCTSNLDFLRFYTDSSPLSAKKESQACQAVKSDVLNGSGLCASPSLKRDHHGNVKAFAPEAAGTGRATAIAGGSQVEVGPDVAAAEDGKPTVKAEAISTGDSGPTGDVSVNVIDLKPDLVDNPVGVNRSGEGNDREPCTIADLKEIAAALPAGVATFWQNGWRSHLCKCSACHAVYDGKGVGYLLDESDTLAAYEDRGRLKERLKDEAVQQQQAADFSSLNRIQQIEILQGINDLKNGLADFLQSFARDGKVVQEEDIRGFFDELRRKRQRVGISHFCR